MHHRQIRGYVASALPIPIRSGALENDASGLGSAGIITLCQISADSPRKDVIPAQTPDVITLGKMLDTPVLNSRGMHWLLVITRNVRGD